VQKNTPRRPASNRLDRPLGVDRAIAPLQPLAVLSLLLLAIVRSIPIGEIRCTGGSNRGELGRPLHLGARKHRDASMAQLAHFAQCARLLAALLSLLAAPVGAGQATQSWVLDRGREIPSPQPSRPTLRVQGQKLSGSTGCNSFTATLSERPDKRVAIEQVSQTRKLCGPRENAMEAAFIRALSQTEFLQQERGRLTFLSGKREVLLVWTRADRALRARSRRSSAHRDGAAGVAECLGHARPARLPIRLALG